MCFILSFSCDFLNSLFLIVCFLIIFGFLFLVGVVEGSGFLRQCKNFQACEFLQPANFRMVTKFLLYRTIHLLPALLHPYNLSFPTLD